MISEVLGMSEMVVDLDVYLKSTQVIVLKNDLIEEIVKRKGFPWVDNSLW
jgi:hypothetical protein